MTRIELLVFTLTSTTKIERLALFLIFALLVSVIAASAVTEVS